MDFTPYDYVFEDVKKFEDVLPFLLPKLDGEWHILLVEPKPSYIRTYLDTSVIPSYIHLLITVEPTQLADSGNIVVTYQTASLNGATIITDMKEVTVQ